MHLSLIVARAANGVIGAGGGMPWHLPEDLAWFRAKTLGHPCIMGRGCWESLGGKPLAGRPNLVISRRPDFRAPGALVFPTFADALHAARFAPEVFVLGGGVVYRDTLPLVQTAWVTEIEFEPEGDTFFPELPASEWRREDVRRVEAADGKPAYTFCRWERIAPAPDAAVQAALRV